MRPLNNFRNIVFNKTRIVPIIIILALQIGVIVFMLSIGVSLLDELDFNLINSSKTIIPVLPETKWSEDERNNLKDELQQIGGVIGVVDANYNMARSKMIFFGSGTSIINVRKNDMKLIESSLDMKITSGSLPSKSNEILVSNLNLNAFKASVGQKIGRYASKDSFELKQDYTIAGTFEGPSNIYLSQEGNIEKLPYLMLIVKPGKYEAVDSVLTSKYKNLKNNAGYRHFKSFPDNARTMMSLLGVVAISVFSFGIWVSVMNLMKNSIMARKSEFSFLRSIGYSKKYISKRVFIELFVIVLLGYMTGILLGEIALVIFNSLYCLPTGILFTLWDNMYASIPALVTLLLLICGYLTVNRYIVKLDWVSAMEEAG
jgi:ABC-type antimicrobial peptide transport system permease subunit